MSKPVLVSRDGRIVNTDKHTTPLSVVEEHQEDPLHVIAARAAEQQSTKKTPSKE